MAAHPRRPARKENSSTNKAEYVRTIGVVLAGGIGSRVGLSIPKQMVKIAGKTILEHTVTTMNSSPEIDELIVMITPGWSEQVATLLGERFGKLTRILEGGATRNETTRRLLDAVGPDAAEYGELKLVLHDAVRPLIDDRIIADSVAALDSYGAVDAVIPSSDTIVEVDADEVITNIPPRASLRRGQTPQSFLYSVLRRAYDLAEGDPEFAATDDCGVVLTYLPDVPIKTIEGAEHNMKVTHPIDLYLADKLFQLASQPAPELDLHDLRDKVIVVLGGSYGIGAEMVRIAREAGALVESHGRSTTGLHVESAESIGAAFADAVHKHGRIDAVVLTAGVLRMGRLNETTPEEVAQAVAVNYLAPIHVAQAAYPHLRESRGHLLYFTSSSYTRGRENYSIYSSTKAAVVNLTQALSEEWASAGIKVNVINPERTATPMRSNAFGEEPPGTLLSADDVAVSALAVLTTESTGVVVDVRREQE
ncbi:bifunctional cytidylyltransferase/SDR family oxidoreductase [Rarobacter faecitabidus]|uniref:bifunctional cytidylyltransferase/SDR family oxidoreductase n=1 Tax=Rarobacter faecitabidus TaxID=13243 RepID=UPI001FE3A14B|nr:bifunctional cytidylyltransferase/SDR family oxidoreductase [Rarobacter faecitabidus]